MGQRIEKIIEKAMSGSALLSGFFHTGFTTAPCIPPYSAALHGDTRLIAARPLYLSERHHAARHHAASR